MLTKLLVALRAVAPPLVAALKVVAPLIGGGGAYVALATDVLTGLGVPTWGVQAIGALAIGGGFGPWLQWVMERLLSPANLDRWVAWAGDWMDALGYGIGVFVTGGLSRWTYTKAFWNSTIEPWAIIILKALALPLLRLVPGVVRGLLSDNTEGK